ncbi:MAG: hypothetical protein ACYS8W_16185 [Planctomycetota bacterium]|jgi:hypothetical protein
MSESEDIIRDSSGAIWIRAPKRPIITIRAYSVVDVATRVLILGAIWMLLAVVAHVFEVSYSRSVLFAKDKLSTVMVTAISMAFIIFLSVGVSLLLRLTWVIDGMKVVIFLFCICLFWPVLLPGEVARTAIMVVSPFASFAFLWPLYMYLESDRGKYEFEHVPYAKLEKEDAVSIKRIPVALIAFSGLALPLLFVMLNLKSKITQPGLPGESKFSDYLEYYSVWGLMILHVLLGVCALGLRLRKNSARVLQAGIVSGIGLFSILVFCVLQYKMIEETPSRLVRQMIPLLAVRIVVYSIGFFIFLYMVFEVVRFLASAKMKHWCGVGDYTAPWDRQLVDAGINTDVGKE